MVLRIAGDRARPPTALATGVWFWRLRGRASARNAEGTSASPVWLFRVGTRSADGDRDTSWGNELDVNGDGFSDVAIASTGADNGRGRVDVYYGSASGISAMPSATLRGAELNASFGFSIASAGDVNGDGFGDLVVGAPQSSPSGRMGAGSVHVFLGGSSGIGSIAVVVLEGETASSQFGTAVQGIGDVNADGRADIAAGAPLAAPGGRTEAGAVSVFAGTASGIAATPLRVLEGPRAHERFGSAVAGGGDINGDGVADLAVGSSAAEVMGRVQAGAFSVFHGSNTGPASSATRLVEGTTAYDNLGCALSMGGDVNGDGYSDMIVGARSASPAGITGAGQALLFVGSPSGLSPSAVASFNGTDPGDAVGTTVRIATDVNGDGFSDVVVGAPSAGAADGGSIFLFQGNSTVLSMIPAWRADNIELQGRLPSSLACSGDVNGDGFSDLVAGNSMAGSGGRSSSGVATIWRGSSRGLESTAARTLEGGAPFDAFGASVARATFRASSPRNQQSSPPAATRRQCGSTHPGGAKHRDANR